MVNGGKLVRDNYPDDPDEITDQVGNPYPTDWIDFDKVGNDEVVSERSEDSTDSTDVDDSSDDESTSDRDFVSRIPDVDENGFLTDDHGRQFDPFAGNRVPVDEKCNALLNGWEDRYGEPRYCSQSVFRKPDDDKQKKVFFGGYCNVHKNRQGMMKTAEEALQTGFYSKTVDHLFEGLKGWEKIVAHGLFEHLMGESDHVFAPEYEKREFDFSDEELVPDFADGDDIVRLRVAYPTDHADPAMALWQAAMDRVNMLQVKAEVSTVEKPLQSKTTEHAQLTAPPSEDTPDEFKEEQHFKTIEEWTEHHLNLPYDRLVRSQSELLEYGGVTTDTDDSSTMDVGELVLDVSADGEEVETADTVDSPHAFTEEKPESQRIVESATNEEG